MATSDLDKRMKGYEKEYSRKCIPMLPVFARLDGRSFHAFCKDMEKPFDENFRISMKETLYYLMVETQARVGYTESDEITLMWYTDNNKSQIFFDGKINKMNSILAAMCSVRFNQSCKDVELYDSDYDDLRKAPLFDCRVWQVPNKIEATNVFVWREMDSVRNSIQLAGQHFFSHNELHKKSCNEIQEMLFQKYDINWNDYPSEFKRGIYYRTVKKMIQYDAGTLAKLPKSHEAHKNPDLKIERKIVERLRMPPITKVVNRVGVFFDGEDPETEEETR